MSEPQSAVTHTLALGLHLIPKQMSSALGLSSLTPDAGGMAVYFGRMLFIFGSLVTVFIFACCASIRSRFVLPRRRHDSDPGPSKSLLNITSLKITQD